jgi:nucleoside-diphosphate-sugar epimerase
MKTGVFGLPQEYIDQCINRLGSEIQSLEGKKITILGGTGFFGSWISSILIAGINNGLDLNLNILSRNKPAINDLLDFNNSKIKFQNIDLGNSIPKNLLEVSHIIFSATSSTPFHGNQDTSLIQRTSRSFQKAIESIASSKGVEAILNLSSGAVYKKSYKIHYPIEETNTFETRIVSDYQAAKIEIEKCLIEASSKNPSFKYSSPRLFAFYGPGLPIDAHFAIGNFIENAFNREAIVVKGDKTTVRSYLHIADASTALIK